jgi:hypothetical protein
VEHLQIFLDGSGDPKLSEGFVTLAGVVASADEWQRVSEVWSRLLTACGVEAFHMTDAMSGRREFQGWTEDQINDKLLGPLTGLIMTMRTRGAFACAVEVDLSAYQSVGAIPGINLDPVDRLSALLTYEMLLQGIHQLHPTGAIKLDFIFDRNESFLKHVKKFDFEDKATRRTLANWRGCRPGIRAGTSTEEAVGIQVADMLGWSFRRRLVGDSGYSNVRTALIERLSEALPTLHAPIGMVELTRKFVDPETVKGAEPTAARLANIWSGVRRGRISRG